MHVLAGALVTDAAELVLVKQLVDMKPTEQQLDEVIRCIQGICDVINAV